MQGASVAGGTSVAAYPELPIASPLLKVLLCYSLLPLGGAAPLQLLQAFQMFQKQVENEPQPKPV